MSSTAESVQRMAAGMNLDLTPDEAARITEIVETTGSHTPEADVVALFHQRGLTSNMLTYFVPWMWVTRSDDSPVPTETWRAMFCGARYTENRRVISPPRKTVRAYRGATEANKAGLSWTLDVDQARYFARERQAPGSKDARVWVADIPAERVFARFMDGWEKEIAADVQGLKVYPIEEEHQLPRLHWWQRLAPR